MSQWPRPLPIVPSCVVCGETSTNPHAYRLRWLAYEDRVEARFTAALEHTGYPDRVHGGVISGLLDEAIFWAVAVASGRFPVTRELAVRYHRPLPTGQPVTIVGRKESGTQRSAQGIGEIRDDAGTVYATASGEFVLMPQSWGMEMNRQFRYQPGDLDVLAEK
ncbi:MAG: PaaI family thioesterase [Deinococcus sp.]|nr:PaaI family thioesterase [Deinococcus sp.]